MKIDEIEVLNKMSATVNTEFLSVIKHFNEIKIPAIFQLPEFKKLKSIKELVAEDKTFLGALYSSILSTALMEVFENAIPGFKEDRQNGHDFIFPLDENEVRKGELKVTFSDGNFWCGSKHSDKTNLHLLVNFALDENFKIEGIWAGVIYLDENKKSSWQNSNSKNSGFSKLKLHVEDYDYIFPLIGSMSKEKVWISFQPQFLD